MNEEQGKFLEELYHANFKRMLLELYPILKDMPSAQVAIQEAARLACQKPEEMMSSPNPAGWLRKTAGLVAKNMLREQARQKRTFLPLKCFCRRVNRQNGTTATANWCSCVWMSSPRRILPCSGE